MADSTPVKLVPAKKRNVAQSIVQFLREYLEEAERGEVTAVAIAITRPDGNTSTCWATEGPADVERLGYAAFRLATRMATLDRE